MKTYAKINDATQDMLGRIRNRWEVTRGVSHTEVEGLKCLESLRLLHTEGTYFKAQTVSSDYKTITITGTAGYDTYINNALTDTPILCMLGGEFIAKESIKKRVKVRRDYYVYKMVDVNVVHKVLVASYRVAELIENADGSCDVRLEIVE